MKDRFDQPTSSESTSAENAKHNANALNLILLSDASPKSSNAKSDSDDNSCSVDSISWAKKYKCETDYLQSNYYSSEKLNHSSFSQDVTKFSGHIQTKDDYISALTKTARDIGDAWTFFKSDAQMEKESEHSKLGFRSSGVWIKDQGGKPVVEAVLAGFPAYKTMRPGDQIESINGKSVLGLNAQSLEPLLEGKAGDQLNIKFKTNDGKEDSVKFALGDPEQLHSSATIVKDKESGKSFLKLKMSSFSKDACDELEDAIKSLKSSDLSAVSGIILDLRGNEGGSIPPILRTADMFVPPGTDLFRLDSRDGSEVMKSQGFAESDYTLDAATRSLLRKLPLTVLIDGTTRSAPETLLGSLKEQGRVASVVGTKSFGKGVVYYDMDAPEGAMRVSQEVVRTPRGVDWHEKGIMPDVVIDNPRHSNKDLQLDAAIRVAKRTPR